MMLMKQTIRNIAIIGLIHATINHSTWAWNIYDTWFVDFVSFGKWCQQLDNSNFASTCRARWQKKTKAKNKLVHHHYFNTIIIIVSLTSIKLFNVALIYFSHVNVQAIYIKCVGTRHPLRFFLGFNTFYSF